MSRPRVLIVDDDEQICRVSARALEEIAICDAAHDVGQATRALQRAAYELVLVDVGLPGPSGMTLLDELRRYWPQTGALMLSGTTELSVANEALERGALGYVVKPFRVRDLRIQVTAALSGARRSAEATRAATRARIVAELNAHLAADDGTIACIVVDLEHIPVLNASYGVAAIDQLCACVEQRLREFDPDVEVLGPLGPTTLAASLKLHPIRAASHSARALHGALSRSALIEGTWIPISARLGVAVAALAASADSVLSLAEGAADAARDCAQPFVVYDGDLRPTERIQQELLADAVTAIHCGQLRVAYQRQHHLTTGHCVGVEALARWHHPIQGDIPAAVFIPIAERMGLIDELGAHVLRTACADLRLLRRESRAETMRVSVNASTAELRDLQYPARVASALAEADLPGAALRIEITESHALDGSEEIDRVLTEIRRLGVELSVDDFGTGYSSFGTLTRLPWAELKLDRSLTIQYADAPGRAMLRAILDFGASLDIDVIAEGIETVAQLEALRALGCRYGQGYLFGRPEPIGAVAGRFGRAAA